MNKKIKDFLEELKKFPYVYSNNLLDEILSDKNLLEEALNQKEFLEIFSPETKLYGHSLNEAIFSTLKEFPDKFLNLPVEYFTASILKMTKGMFKKLPEETRQRIINRLIEITEKECPVLEQPVSFYDDDTFLLELPPNYVEKILLWLLKRNKVKICLAFFDVLFELEEERFKKIISNPELKIWAERPTANSIEFPSIGHRDIVLSAILEERVLNPEYILQLKEVPKEYLDKNAAVLINQISFRDAEEIIKIHKLSGRDSDFVLELAKKYPEFCEYLSVSDYEKFIDWVKEEKLSGVSLVLILRNPCIEKYPEMFEKALKAYCGLKRPPIPEKQIEIPDEILQKLTPKQVKGLVEKAIDEKGRFCHNLKFNPEIALQKLTSVIVSEPEYYKEKLAGKLQAAIEKHKNGSSVVERICKYLSISDEDTSLTIKADKKLEEIIDKILSLPREIQKKAFMFVIDYLDTFHEKDKLQKMELKYKDLSRKLDEKLF